MERHAENMVKIGKKFLKDTEDYFTNHAHKLSCDDIYKTYRGFRHVLKDFKGNSNGFTGLSEYLIFKSLWGLLGGEFCVEKCLEGIGNQFASTSNSNLCIGQNVPFSIGSKKYKPDITLFNKKELIAIIQIKTYLVGGDQTILREYEVLKQLRTKHKSAYALLILYGSVPEEGKLFKRLSELQKRSDWFDFLILKNNTNLLKKELGHLLKLKNLLMS